MFSSFKSILLISIESIFAFCFTFYSHNIYAENVSTQVVCDIKASSLLPVLDNKSGICAEYKHFLSDELPFTLETCQLKSGDHLTISVSQCNAFAPLRIAFWLKHEKSVKKEIVIKEFLNQFPFTGQYFKLSDLIFDKNFHLTDIKKENLSLNHFLELEKKDIVNGAPNFVLEKENCVDNNNGTYDSMTTECKTAFEKHFQLTPEQKASLVYFKGVDALFSNGMLFRYANMQYPCDLTHKNFDTVYAYRTWSEIQLDNNATAAERINAHIKKEMTVGKVLTEKCNPNLNKNDEWRDGDSNYYINNSQSSVVGSVLGTKNTVSFGGGSGRFSTYCEIFSLKDAYNLGKYISRKPHLYEELARLKRSKDVPDDQLSVLTENCLYSDSEFMFLGQANNHWNDVLLVPIQSLSQLFVTNNAFQRLNKETMDNIAFHTMLR